MSDVMKLRRLEVEECIVRTPTGTIEIGGASGHVIRFCDSEGRTRLVVGYEAEAWGLELFEADPTEPENIRCRAHVTLDDTGLVSVLADDGAGDNVHACHVVGFEAAAADRPGDLDQTVTPRFLGRRTRVGFVDVEPAPRPRS